MSVFDFSKLPLQELGLCLSPQNHDEENPLLQQFFTNKPQLVKLQTDWLHLQNLRKNQPLSHSEEDIEYQEVEWLMTVFNTLFEPYNVILVRGENEPEYFPATESSPARIEFAHGFFQSALHEISHWCIAGKHRRTKPDFGYWYAPDGRTEAQQIAFEKVEIKPQAIECLFTLMCNKKFRVSQDNLHANFDTSQSTFVADVYQQTAIYIHDADLLPTDARLLLTALSYLCQ